MNSLSLLRVEPRCFGPVDQQWSFMTELRSSLTGFMTELRIVGQLGALMLERHPSKCGRRVVMG